MTTPFPIAVSDYDHHSWRNWIQQFPFARVANADERPLKWMHPEDLQPCRKVAVGLYVTAEFAWSQLGAMTPLCPDDVRHHLVNPPNPADERPIVEPNT